MQQNIYAGLTEISCSGLHNCISQIILYDLLNGRTNVNSKRFLNQTKGINNENFDNPELIFNSNFQQINKNFLLHGEVEKEEKKVNFQ